MLLPKGFLEKIVPFLTKNMYLECIKTPENFGKHMEGILTYGFSVNWGLGGTAGSCWDDSLINISPDPEQELTKLDDFLMEHYPQTSFLQFRKISHSIKTSQFSDSDYYGGTTYYAKKSLSFSDLAESLVSLKLEENNDMMESESFSKSWFIDNISSNITNKEKIKKKIK